MKKNFEDLVTNALDYKEQVYTANGVEIKTNLKNSSIGKKQVPETLLKAFNDFEAQGGSKNLKSAHKLLVDVCLMSGDLVKKIRAKLEEERKENHAYIEKYKDLNLWNLPPSELVNQQFFNEMSGKFIHKFS
jgi:ALIX V-shaped domain binding to HIV